MEIEFTNGHQVPALFLKALEKDYHHVDGDISVTELIGPPQIRMYKKEGFTMKIDAVQEIWRMIGTAMHAMLEEAGYSEAREALILSKASSVLTSLFNKTGEKKYQAAASYLKTLSQSLMPQDNRFVLERTYSNFFPEYGLKLYGTVDLEDRLLSRLEDYKLTKSWAYKFQEEKSEWEEQLNVYRYLKYLEDGVLVPDLLIWTVLRDWIPANTNKKNYPPRPVMPVKLKVWSLDEAETFVRKRLELHSMVREGNPVLCSGKDRWAEAAVYKIYRTGQKTALFTSDDEAIAKDRLEDIQLKYPNAYLEEIPGINKRCMDYCPVSSVCQQWKNIQDKIIEL